MTVYLITCHGLNPFKSRTAEGGALRAARAWWGKTYAGVPCIIQTEDGAEYTYTRGSKTLTVRVTEVAA